MTSTFHAVKASDIPGDTLLKLTKPWGVLPAGSLVRPQSAGFNNVSNRLERVVTVIKGPYAGKGPLAGPF